MGRRLDRGGRRGRSAYLTPKPVQVLSAIGVDEYCQLLVLDTALANTSAGRFCQPASQSGELSERSGSSGGRSKRRSWACM
jgi:hypothetical protein